MTHSTLWIKDAEGTYRPATADEVFEAHRKCLNQRFRRGRVIGSPDEIRAYLVGQLAHEPAEIFAVLYLDLCAAHSNVELDHQDRLVKRIRRCQLHINAVIAGASS